VKTLAARCVQLLNTDPEPRPRDPRVVHVPARVDIELAAQKLLATAARQGQTLTITHKPRKGSPGHFVTQIRVEDV
jgi:hypothetical protein